MTIILFILILSLIIVIHEFGHFLFAKLYGVYVYEFSLGMGKKLWSTKKGETEYSIRLIPLGGFVSLAGETVEEDNDIPKDRRLQSKSVFQRFMIMFAGAGMNFVLALVLLFFSALIFGSVTTKPIIGNMEDEYPAYQAGIRENDTIISIDGKEIDTWEDAMWEVQMSNGKTLDFVLEDENGITKYAKVTPEKQETDEGTTYIYGISKYNEKEYGLAQAGVYAFEKLGSTFKLMGNTIKSLFVGQVGVDDLSGPVGIFTVIDAQAKAGVESVIYLIAFLSVNVGVINLIPFPAFDGGRILFLFIEKIKGSPVDSRLENTIHNIGFMLLMLLMIYVTFNDVFRIIK